MPTAARDGQTWRVGTSGEVAWIDDGTSVGMTIGAAIPAVFEAYATLVLPDDREQQDRHDRAILAVLRRNSGDQPWWLGYLDTGVDDVVFPDSPMVTLYAGWRYVLVEAGPEQAATWRRPPGEIRSATAWSSITAVASTDATRTARPAADASLAGQARPAWPFSKGALPDLMFPADQSWLLSTLWDDDWTCLGGPARLVADVLRHPDLQARQVSPGEDATPPGHKAF